MTTEIQTVSLQGEVAGMPIRPFQEEDRERVQELRNNEGPAHYAYTADLWRKDDATMTGNEVYIRLVVGNPAIAFLSATDRTTTSWRVNNTSDFRLVVDWEHRSHGIGSALYEHAEAFVRERKLGRINTSFWLHGEDDPAVAFLTKRGFKELERENPSSLDVNSFDFSRFAGVVEKVEAQGIRFFTYADVPDSEGDRRKLYDLWSTTFADIPHRDEEFVKVPGFEQWIKDMLEFPTFSPEGNVIAADGDNWIGISQLEFRKKSDVASTWLTALRATYRGRGIAIALKLKAIGIARAKGSRIITTENHEDNAPMLAINRKLGFVPDPPLVSYIKELQPRESVMNTNMEKRMRTDLLEQQKAETSFVIRPFKPEDMEAVVAMINHNQPWYNYYSVEEWKRQDADVGDSVDRLRLCVGEPAIAYMQIWNWETGPWFRMEGVAGMALWFPEYRRRGIGSMLYRRALQFAQERNLRRIVTWFLEQSPDEPAISFLTRRGFHEQERGRPSHLDVETFDFSRFTGVIEQVEQQGIGILSYADVEDNKANRRKLYELCKEIEFDMPRNDTQPFEFAAFEQWVKMFNRPEWVSEAVILAEDNGKWVGISQLAFRTQNNVGLTYITGMLRDYRGRKIATALKLRAIEVARQRNCRVIITENHENNGPMLAINRKLGFIPDAEEVSYNKVLRED